MPKTKKASLIEELEQEEQIEKAADPIVEEIKKAADPVVEEIEKTADPVVGETSPHAKVTCDVLNIRAGSSMDSQIVGLLSKDAKIKITGREENGFYPMIDDRDQNFKVTGFVKSDFIRFI